MAPPVGPEPGRRPTAWLAPPPTDPARLGADRSAPPIPGPDPLAPAGDSLTDGSWRRFHPLTPWLRGWAALGAFIAVLYNVMRDDAQVLLSLWRQGGILAVVGLVLVLVAAVGLYTLIRWRMARFRIGSDAVELVSGILMRRQRSLKLDRLEAVDLVHPLLARIFGLVDLKLESAGGQDSNLTLAYLTASQAEAVQAELLLRSGRPAPFKPSAAHSPTGPTTHPQTGFEAHPSIGPTANLQTGPTAHPLAGPGPLSQTGPASYPLAGPGPHPLAGPRPDRSTAATGWTGPEPGAVVFRVPFGLTVRAYLRSPTPWFSLVAVSAPLFLALATARWSVLATSLPIIFGCVQAFRRHIFTEANFSAFLQADELRLRHGLTTQVNQTIPLGRIQAIRLTQRWLWRRPDWWRIEIAVAGYAQDDQAARSVLLPVGSSATVAATLAVILPPGVSPSLWAALDAAQHGPWPDDGFSGSPRRARLFDPGAWRRRGFRKTPGAVLIRSGWLIRQVVVAPPERTQAITLRSGPLARRRRLVDVHFHYAPALLGSSVRHLDPADAADLLTWAVPRAAGGPVASVPESGSP
jgi:putative membrane protein